MIRLFAPVLFAAVLGAQQPVPAPKPPQGQGQGEQEVEEAASGDKATARKEAELRGEAVLTDEGKEVDLEALKNLTPEQRLARNVTHGFGSFARVHTGMKPARLMPGQTGTLTVIVTFLGDTVVPAPPPVTIVSSPQQGALTVGGPSYGPPKEAKLAKAFVGRQVYDNYLTMELPVTAAPTAAQHSKHPVNVELQVDLYSGTTGQAIGRFVDRASHTIEIGVAPDPAVAIGGRPPAAPTSGVDGELVIGDGGDEAQLPAGDAAAPENEPAVVPAGSDDGAGAPSAGAAPASEDRSTIGTVPEAEGADGMSFLLLLGGGAVLMLAVVFLLAKKR